MKIGVDGKLFLNTNPLAYAAENELNQKIKALDCYIQGAQIVNHHWDSKVNTITFFYVVPEGMNSEQSEKLESNIKKIVAGFNLGMNCSTHRK